MVKKLFQFLLCFGTVSASPIAAASVPEVILVVLPLKSETLRQCEDSSIRFLRAKGFGTSVRREGTEFVKIFGKKAFNGYSLQVECDQSLKTKALAFSHPSTSSQLSVNSIIDGLLY